MDELLACPRCGSTYFFSFTLGGQKIVFRVNGMYLPVGLDEDPQDDLAHIEPERIRCASCSWGGGLKELVPAKD